MANANQEPERDELEHKKKAGWKRDSEAEQDSEDQPTQGLRTQGSINIVPVSAPKTGQQGLGRRNPPTRHDAMEIAGHERLPGYATPYGKDNEPAAAPHAAPRMTPPFSEAPELEPMSVPEVPDLKEVTLDADRELKHSADDAESERREDQDEARMAEPFGERKERDSKALDEEASDAEEAKG